MSTQGHAQIVILNKSHYAFRFQLQHQYGHDQMEISSWITVPQDGSAELLDVTFQHGLLSPGVDHWMLNGVALQKSVGKMGDPLENKETTPPLSPGYAALHCWRSSPSLLSAWRIHTLRAADAGHITYLHVYPTTLQWISPSGTSTWEWEKLDDIYEELTIRVGDDWHVHVRDGEDILKTTVPAVAAQFARAIIMPNTKPPITTTQQALEYRSRIIRSLCTVWSCNEQQVLTKFVPLMTLYMTEETTVDEIKKAYETGLISAVKLYPAGATTNSASGVTDITRVYAPLRMMATLGMPLLVHGEVTDPTIDLFDRERVFIDRHLRPLMLAIPDLRLVMEHVTTRDAVEWVRSQGPNVGATITAHHLLYNRNAIFQGGLQPHMYCLPVLKRETHRLALVEAATSGDPKFFAGTDSAPHPRASKETSCGCAGCYTAFAATELYTEVFDRANALNKLEAFLSTNGAHFYGMSLNEGRITVRRSCWRVPATYDFGTDVVVPLRAGEIIPWTVVRHEREHDTTTTTTTTAANVTTTTTDSTTTARSDSATTA